MNTSAQLVLTQEQDTVSPKASFRLCLLLIVATAVVTYGGLYLLLRG